jgi:hypothetical protein
MNKKVGLAIVTYTINYGTFLQAFATQYAVRELGYETEILNINSVIDDVSRARKKYFLKQIFNVAELKSYRHTISAIIAQKLNNKYKTYMSHRENCFKQFNKNNFVIGEKCDSWTGLSAHCNDFSSILVGSDQLWRPANIAGNFYTLNFVPDHVNKISYATSFGLKEIRSNQRNVAAAFLNRIQYLSCREESGTKIIKGLTGRSAKVVCDPTLLLKQNDWNQYLSEKPIIEEDYVLTYLLSNNKKHREYARKLAAQTSCKVVGILHGAGYIKGDEKYVDEAPVDVGPFEFLNLIKHAKYVCTDSFHGCVFSTIFEKNFYAFKRFSDLDKMSTNTRVTGLLNKFELLGRLVEDYDEICLDSIDYSKVNEKVEEFRDHSLDFLTSALKQNNEVI